MKNTIALVTGANKGIGFEIARGLGAAGATVLIGARDEGRGAAAAETLQGEGLDTRFVRLDVTDENSISDAAKLMEADFGRLDVLVNNAGIVSEDGVRGTPPSGVSLAAVREVYETNVFGVIAVTNAMLPLLRRSAAGRIVNMSSELGSLGWLTDASSPFYEVNVLPYNTSKSALNGVTVAYAKELKDTAIKVNAVTPGYCATDLNHNSGFRTPAEGAAIAIKMALLGEDGPTGGFFNDEGEVAW